jgi:hypothetical protein
VGANVNRFLLVFSIVISFGGVSFAHAEDVTFDFRGPKEDVESRFTYSPNKAVADRYFHFDDKGLRIAWTAAEKPQGAVGLIWNYRGFHEDFVATVHFELLNADPARDGTGIELYLQLNNSTGDGLPFSRSLRKEGHVWLAQMRTGPNNARKTEGFKMEPADPEAKGGRLKLERKGEIVTASYAEGDEESYKELKNYNIGPVGIRMVRISGLSSGSDAAQLDLRIMGARLKIDSQDMPAQVAPAAKGLSAEGSRTALWAVLILGTLSLFIFLAVFTFVKRKKSKVDALAESPASNPAEGPDAESNSADAQGADAQSAPIRLDCPACGKKLKLKDKLAGKRVKCPQCGGELRVPF